MKKFLTICPKNVHFSFNFNVSIQIDEVAMAPPLGPVIANIFMVELESVLVPTLNENISKMEELCG